MIDETWKLFCQTGNIEAYLLLKELEKDPLKNNDGKSEQRETVTVDTFM